MINLIPKEEKKKMTVDFYYRLAVLFFLTLDFSIFIAFFSVLPSYFMSSLKYSLVSAKLETQKLEPLPPLGEQSLGAVNNINGKLLLVEKFEKNKFLISTKVINTILSNKRPDIKITQIVYENNGEKGKRISINGTAASREVLLLFRQALEDSPNFKNVDLPISNFVKGANIDFYLSLIPS